MSSGFVSGGTVEEPAERDDEWLKAQQELEAERRQKAEAEAQDGGKSLYEILQQNKAAKQEAFEESIKLKNQFRTLDEDEVEYLDSLLESTRAQEAALKKETMEQLEMFHRQRQQVEKVDTESAGTAGGVAGLPVEDEQWTTSGRKRRRGKEKDAFPGVKLRKSSSSTENKSTENGQNKVNVVSEPSKKTTSPTSTTAPGKAANPNDTRTESKPVQPTAPQQKQPSALPTSSGLGLGGYSSDED
ncbi:hypothetical protein AJ80_00849 [Polytolypa hystricis UAMH7299]|uniref:FAM192A/Fyv6 N-terminal domain-containing protein n=1 Tax=Polytolypa hystricis (strain UAMH7299) TaxID=1447883 RepID=A0A2B7Z229_POLH7|nr:hypothetical protein AJ80_00849 [Polytolypa hystricis UAMH7299]